MNTRRLFALLFAISLFTMAVRATLDPDMWWHLRTGEYILQEGMPRQDIFSFTVPDHAWITHEWLSQVIMWGVYRAGQLPALMIFFAALSALATWLVYRCSPGRPFLPAFVALLAALASSIIWGARPQIFNLVMTAAFVHIVERAKDRQLPRGTLWLLPLLTVVWANLHSGFLLGTVLLGTYVVGESLQRWTGAESDRTLDWPTIRYLILVTVAGFLLAAVNPNGAELWLYPFSTLGSPAMQAYIQEWRSPDFHLKHFWPFGLMMGLGIISWVFSRKRPTWSEIIIFLGTAAAGLMSARHIPLFTIIAIPIISRHLLSSFENTRVYPIFVPSGSSPSPTPLMAALNWTLLVVALFASVLWTATNIAKNESAIVENYPVAAVDYLEQAGLAGVRGYNNYGWGGYLIWRGLPVFVDGRADVYGDDFLFYYRKTYDVKEDWRRPLDDYEVEYVLMQKGSALSTVLAASGSWEEAYVDELAQIFVRTS